MCMKVGETVYHLFCCKYALDCGQGSSVYLGFSGFCLNQFLQCWHVGRGDFLDGWGEGIGVVWGAVFVPFVDGLEGVQP